MEVEQPEAIVLTRRRIYLQRLIGDDVLGSKAGPVHRESWIVVPRFLVYLVIATAVIYTRAGVQTLYEINHSFETWLQKTSVPRGPSSLAFEDITTRSDMQLWIRHMLFDRIVGDTELTDFRRNLTLLSFNRVLPGKGVCTESASVLLTMRRVRTTFDSGDTVSNRFKQIYPRTWVTGQVPAGHPRGSDVEAKDTLIGAGTSTWWRHTDQAEGYLGQGGYVATASFGSNGEAHVHLVDFSESAQINSNVSEGACFGIPVTATLREKDFWDQGYFDPSFSSLVLEFMSYNANLQTMTRATAVFNANFAGLITEKLIRCESIRLDIYSSTMRYLETAYLICTFCYFSAFLLDSYRKFPGHFKEPWSWINLISIAMSFTSLGLWYSYEPLLERYLWNGSFRDPNLFQECFDWLSMYKWASAVATLMIYLRLLQFLAKTRPRVLLLAKTLTVGAKNMLIYMLYVGVILCGSAAFAQTYFSSFSPNFVSIPLSLLNCYNLFFGNIECLKSIDPGTAPLKNLFYVPFMVFFYFVSVQMFNAIINYSYNLVSEDMEPQFEQERLEKKRKAAFGVTDSKSDLIKILRMLKTYLIAGKAEAPGAVPKDPSEKEGRKDNSKTKDKRTAAAELDELGEEAKAKVEEYERRNDSKKAPDSPFVILRFVLFAIAYVWFLSANLSVYDNFQINSAVRGSIASFPTRVSGRESFVFEEIMTLAQAAQWMKDSLPKVIFNTTAPETTQFAVDLGLYDHTAVCIKTWNCLVALLPNLPPATNRMDRERYYYEERQLVRITQRRAQQRLNEGRAGEQTPARLSFAGELDAGTGLPASRSLVPTRVVASLGPDDPASSALENSSALELAPSLRSFCKVAADGDVTSFSSNGGMVCLLNANRSIFVSQLQLLMANDFITSESSVWVVDFAMQNSNRQILSYVQISFQVLRSGVVEAFVDVDSIRLFNFGKAIDNFRSIAMRIIPGFVYLLLTAGFTKSLWDEYQKKRRQRTTPGVRAIDMEDLRILYDFFWNDKFNFLEFVSIFISVFSSVLFVMWTIEDAKLDVLKEQPLADFLSYCVGAVRQARLYNRLSAVNILMIGVRPLKFVRENPRLAKLNQTLYEASEDLMWFVVMLFVTMAGFVMLAYISFGAHASECANLWVTLVFCFRFLLGDFDYTKLLKVDPIMTAFMFPNLLIMYCVFTNIFFAIIDRHFVAIDPPPTQWLKKLKPIFGRICRCINWDTDLVMEDDPNAPKVIGPPSRRDRVRRTQATIKDILLKTSNAGIGSNLPKKTMLLSDVCDTDEKMEDVMSWSQDEAKNLVAQIYRLVTEKRNATNEEEFVKARVMSTFVKEELAAASRDMLEAGRQMRYASRVHERMALRDQETLAKYIVLLERLIYRHDIERKGLAGEVQQLQGENSHADEEARRKAHAENDTPTRNLSNAGPDHAEEDDGSDAPSMSTQDQDSSTGGNEEPPQAIGNGEADEDEQPPVPPVLDPMAPVSVDDAEDGKLTNITARMLADLDKLTR